MLKLITRKRLQINQISLCQQVFYYTVDSTLINTILALILNELCCLRLIRKVQKRFGVLLLWTFLHWFSRIDIRENIFCSLAWPTCLVLVEYLCHLPLPSCGTTIRFKTKFLLYYLLHSFKFKTLSEDSMYIGFLCFHDKLS